MEKVPDPRDLLRPFVHREWEIENLKAAFERFVGKQFEDYGFVENCIPVA